MSDKRAWGFLAGVLRLVVVLLIRSALIIHNVQGRCVEIKVKFLRRNTGWERDVLIVEILSEQVALGCLRREGGFKLADVVKAVDEDERLVDLCVLGVWNSISEAGDGFRHPSASHSFLDFLHVGISLLKVR